jgi:hypothetical protein
MSYMGLVWASRVIQIDEARVGNCGAHVVIGTRYPSFAIREWEIGERRRKVDLWKSAIRDMERVCRIPGLCGLGLA